MASADLFSRFGVALVIGILIGLQREHAHGEPDEELFAGVRTFALMGLLGCTAAFAADILGSPWVFIAITAVLGSLLAIAYFVSAWRGEIGLTTEAAVVVTILAGALCYWNQLALAAALAVATMVLLSLKLEMHRFAQRLTREDIYATLKFAVITAIILPVLPNQTYGPPPLNVLNPYKIWLLVVLISGISFLGYVLIKLIGPSQGIGLTGLLGGLTSSTAVTLSFTQRSQKSQGLARPFALAIMVAWTVMFVRVVVEVTAVNVGLARVLWPPMAAAGLAGTAYCLYLYRKHRVEEKEEIEFSNPFELAPAVKFALIFAVILLMSKAAQTYLGNAGLYLSSIVSGLADVDAIALSMAELSGQPDGLAPQIAARATVLATFANTCVKGAIVVAGGAPGLRNALLPGFLLMLVSGVGVAFLM